MWKNIQTDQKQDNVVLIPEPDSQNNCSNDIKLYNEAILVIDNFNSSDERTYQCIAIIKERNITKNVSILYLPPTIEVLPSRNPVFLAPSENFNVTCRVNTSDPDIGCKWTYELFNPGNYPQIVIQNETIKIQSFNAKYEGVYTACSFRKSLNELLDICTSVCLYSKYINTTSHHLFMY